MNDPAVLGLGAALLNSNINSPAARQANIPIPYAGFNGTVAQALRRYPQYQNIQWRGLPLGRSWYNALEVVLEQRLSRRAPVSPWLHLFQAEEQRRGERAG